MSASLYFYPQKKNIIKRTGSVFPAYRQQEPETIKKEEMNMPLMTMTSGIGCGVFSIADAVSARLAMTLFDDKKLQEEARKMDIDTREIENVDVRAPGLLSRILDLKPHAYMELLESVVLEAASEGEGIFLGHSAAFLLQDFDCAFHLRIYSAPSERIKRMMTESNLSYEDAKATIKKTDEDSKGFIHYAFHRNWDDPAIFDLIINLDKMGEEATVDLIVQAVQTPRVKACNISALEALDRLSLRSRVKAVVRKMSLKPEAFQVEVPATGVVRVSGEMNPLESKDRLLDAIRSIPGVATVHSFIGGEKIHDI
jgi:cytidylate kinase